MTQPSPPKITFPCEDYVIKVMGSDHQDFRGFVADVLNQYDNKVTVSSFTERPSSKGRFVSLTVKMTIQSENDLSSLFEALKKNPLVKMVL